MTPTLHLAENSTQQGESSAWRGPTEKGSLMPKERHEQELYYQASLRLSALRPALLGH